MFVKESMNPCRSSTLGLAPLVTTVSKRARILIIRSFSANHNANADMKIVPSAATQLLKLLTHSQVEQAASSKLKTPLRSGANAL